MAVPESVRRIVSPAWRRLRYRSWRGVCPICERGVRFFAKGPWRRDQLICGRCGTVPRERALMATIQLLFPNWRELAIHESSPGAAGASGKLRQNAPGYVESQYDAAVPPGGRHPRLGYRSENLEAQTFADESFDLVISQDVFEHVFRPDLAIAEIARTLKPGGAHIMTVPIVNKAAPSRRRASLVDGQIVHHLEPEYHGNPIDPNGSLVTVDWGFDLAEFLSRHSGMPTTLYSFDDRTRGMQAEYLEVVVSWKRSAPVLD